MLIVCMMLTCSRCVQSGRAPRFKTPQSESRTNPHVLGGSTMGCGRNVARERKNANFNCAILVDMYDYARSPPRATLIGMCYARSPPRLHWLYHTLFRCFCCSLRPANLFLIEKTIRKGVGRWEEIAEQQLQNRLGIIWGAQGLIL